MIKAFEIGKTYSARSACDYNCVFTFKVVARTEKSVTLQSSFGVKRRKVRVWGGSEACSPLGSYSMAPVLFADRNA